MATDRLVLDIASGFASQNVMITEPSLNFVQKLEFSCFSGNFGLCDYHGIFSSEGHVCQCSIHGMIGMIVVHHNQAQ